MPLTKWGKLIRIWVGAYQIKKSLQAEQGGEIMNRTRRDRQIRHGAYDPQPRRRSRSASSPHPRWSGWHRRAAANPNTSHVWRVTPHELHSSKEIHLKLWTRGPRVAAIPEEATQRMDLPTAQRWLYGARYQHQINYSPTRYIMRSDLNYFVNRAHAGLEDDECDLESWIYRLESAWGLYAG